MSKKELEKRLKQSLFDLESAAAKITRTRGYTREAKALKTLSELMKEQLSSENTSIAASKAR